MQHQLIVVILGTDKHGILSEISTTVSEANCNILDSRHAIYGRDFSLTMILEGSHTAITRAELTLPGLCQRLDLLSMMKRTSEHEKQNLEHMFFVEFRGKDTPGQIKKVTGFFADCNASISAFRQHTYNDDTTGDKMTRCKFMVTVADPINFEQLQQGLMALFNELNLTGTIADQNQKENNEHITSWD